MKCAATYESQLMYTFWLLGCVLLANLYVSVYFVLMSLPEYQKPIDTIDDLNQIALSDPRTRITTYADSLYYNRMVEATAGDYYYALGANIRATNSKQFHSHREMIELMQRPEVNTIAIATHYYLAYSRRMFTKRNFFIGQLNLRDEFEAMAFPRKSPIVGPFNRVIKRCREHGLLDIWLERLFYQQKAENPEATLYGNMVAQRIEGDPLKVYDLFSIFFLWSIGIAFACLIFLVEIVLFFSENWRHKIVVFRNI